MSRATCNDDLATFNSGGFSAASSVCTRRRLPPISRVEHGSASGQLVLKVTGLPQALAYGLRYTALAAGGAPGPWTDVLLTSSKAYTVNGLTPGTSDQFQVSALGPRVYSDWSDPVSIMCL